MSVSDPIRPVASQRHGLEPIPLSDQLENHDEFRDAPTEDLAGRQLMLYLEDGSVVDVTFETSSSLRWYSTSESLREHEGTDEYEGVELREGIYAITVSRLHENRSALVILDLAADRVLVNLTTFVTTDGDTREQTDFYQAGIGAPIAEPFIRTEELVGKRVAHRYSSTHIFEHIYLNPNTYVFQGLVGPEAGISAADPADYWKLGSDLYLLSWHEQDQPWNGAVVVDLQKNRSTGRMVGWDFVGEKVLQARTGAISTLLSTTSYDGL